MKLHKTILQIIPADGWQVVYQNKDGTEGINRIACFALIEEVEVDGDGVPYGRPARYIAPFDATEDAVIEEASDNVNFVRIERCNPSERWKDTSPQ